MNSEHFAKHEPDRQNGDRDRDPDLNQKFTQYFCNDPGSSAF